MALRFRRGSSEDRPAGGTVAGEPRFDLDTGKLFVDNGEVNVEITPNATNVDPVVAELLADEDSDTRTAIVAHAEALRESLGASMVGNAVFTGDAEAGRNALSAVSQEDLDALHAQSTLPAAYYTPADKSNGVPAALDSGQAVTVFGNSPGSVVSGEFAHTPTTTGSTASYLQVDAGGRVRRVTCEVKWPSGSVGALAIVLPVSAWGPAGGWDSSSAAMVAAGLHLVIFGNGLWHCSRWNAPGETIYADNTTHGRFSDIRDGAFHTIDLWIDPDTGRATLFFPDGNATSFQSDYIKNDTSTWAIWELYEFNGSSDIPCTIRAISADTQVVRPDSFGSTKLDIAVAQAKMAQNKWALDTTATAAATTTLSALSSPMQQFYGTSTQIVVMPSVGVQRGYTYYITNASTGVVTVQSSNGNTLGALSTGNTMRVICVTDTPTTSSHWGTSIEATVNTTQTFTGKRIDPRVTSAASAPTLSPSISTADLYAYTALAANLTINAPSGTVDGARIRYRLKDNGTTRTLTWNSIFRAIGVTIPVATTAGKTLYVDTVYNAADTKWDVVSVMQEA